MPRCPNTWPRHFHYKQASNALEFVICATARTGAHLCPSLYSTWHTYLWSQGKCQDKRTPVLEPRCLAGMASLWPRFSLAGGWWTSGAFPFQKGRFSFWCGAWSIFTPKNLPGCGSYFSYWIWVWPSGQHGGLVGQDESFRKPWNFWWKTQKCFWELSRMVQWYQPFQCMWWMDLQAFVNEFDSRIDVVNSSCDTMWYMYM